MKLKNSVPVFAACLSLGVFAQVVDDMPVGFLPPIQIVQGTNTLYNIFDGQPPNLGSILTGVVAGDRISWPGFAAECRGEGKEAAWYNVHSGKNANAVSLPNDRRIAIRLVRSSEKKTAITLFGGFKNLDLPSAR